jgi:hypothetical protein
MQAVGFILIAGKQKKKVIYNQPFMLAIVTKQVSVLKYL